MKILLIVLLCASLTANALLFVQTSRSHLDSVTTPLVLGPETKTGASTSADPPPSAVSDEILAQLKANDPAAIQQLRKLGFSEKVIRALAEAQVDGQFRDRERALQKRYTSHQYWKPYRFDPTANAAYTDIRREKETAMKALLGDNYTPEPSRGDLRLAFLTLDKVYRVRQIGEDYDAMASTARSTDNYGIYIRFPEDQEKLTYLEKEKRAELSQVLTPDELFEYDLRTSRSAISVRSQLTAFDPTEQEFRDIFKLRQEAEIRLGLATDDYSPTANTTRQKMESELDQQVKTLLGDARFAEYKQANDFDYRRFYQIATLLELPRQAAADAQALKTSVQEQRTKIMRDSTLVDPAQRTERLDALAREAETSLRRILSDSGYEAYRRSPSNFLERLKPPVPPPPSKG